MQGPLIDEITRIAVSPKLRQVQKKMEEGPRPQQLVGLLCSRGRVRRVDRMRRRRCLGRRLEISGSFPANAAFMKSIQMGKAAREPVSFAPRNFFSS